MKPKICYLISFMLFFSQFVNAGIITSYGKIDTKISFDECMKRSKLARLELFEDDFGESILDDYYSYLSDDVSITVACMGKKQMVMLFVATQEKNPVYYLRIFEKYIKGEAPIVKKEIKFNKSNKNI